MKINMKYLLNFLLLQLFFINNVYAYSKAITCSDAMIFNYKNQSEAKLSLHKVAQQRAQYEAEKFMNKTIIKPFPTALGENNKHMTIKTALLIEIFWCYPSMPLHSAYYNFYMSNKSVWNLGILNE